MPTHTHTHRVNNVTVVRVLMACGDRPLMACGGDGSPLVLMPVLVTADRKLPLGVQSASQCMYHVRAWQSD